jgi:uncharacterized protein YbjT (DUF2867 family)
VNRILVIGGTGTVGSHVLSQLSTQGAQVCALTRHPDASRFPPQIKVVSGDLILPETLDSCLEGIDTVFLVWTAPATAVAPALQRIAKHARRIVFLSAPHKTPHPFFQQPSPARTLAAQIERLIENSALQWDLPAPWHVRRKRSALVGSPDSRRRSRALAASFRPNRPDRRTRHSSRGGPCLV